jgi:hypothetical protein
MKLSAVKMCWRRLSESTASEIAEAALILPLLFMLLLSIYWFGRAFSIYSTINHAARQAVLTAAAPQCANCAGKTWQTSGFPPDPTVTDVVTDALLAANLDPSQMKASMPASAQSCPNVDPPGVCSNASATKSGGEVTICRNVVLNPNSPPERQACGMIVSFQYPYQFMLPFTSLNKQTIHLQAYADVGGEN